MSVRNLDALFHPRSVAVVGASNRPGSIGAVVVRNLLRGDFAGAVMPVHPDYEAVASVLCHPDVEHLPAVPDLAVLCTPARTVPDLIHRLGRTGCRAAIVVGASPGAPGTPERDAFRTRLLEAAGSHGLRVLGPNTLGLIIPGLGLDASFAHAPALAGDLAFVSQSGAVCTAALDWARHAGIGFSHFVSLGESMDVDLADVLDQLGADPGTRAILVYLESLRGARKFLSAARAASRNKPVLVVRAGRVAEGARAAASHSGALAGADAVYDAAFRRAGMLRVERIDELFDAAETLARLRRLPGDRVVVLTNGGGLGVLATDALVAGGGGLSPLAEATLAALDGVLPSTWPRSNPVDVVGDASPERMAAALRVLLAAPEAETILVLHAPTALAPSEAVAEAVAAVVGEAGGPRRVLAAWMGPESARRARTELRQAGVPTYATPEEAVCAFLHVRAFQRNQEMLTQIPPSLPRDFAPRVEAARARIRSALAEGHEWLASDAAMALLRDYQIPAVETRVTPDAAGAARVARELGFPVALKVRSPDVVHKSDLGGVCLDLQDPAAVRAAARAMAARLHALRPEARLAGFCVQPMARRPGARELIAGASSDPVFGPVVLFGQGGTDVEVIADRAIGLPPLDLPLAQALIDRTRVARLLDSARGGPAADREAVARVLVQIAQLLVDLPEVVELDINPLRADAGGVIALDARVRVARTAGGERLAIRPYPAELEETLALAGGRRVRVRPIRPEDEPAHHAFLAKLNPEDVRFRFFNLVRQMPHSQMARYTQIDYDREMAFIALDAEAPGEPETLGVVRAVAMPDRTQAEFAIVVRSDQKGHGLGHALLEKMIRYCRARGVAEVVGQVLPDNRAMLDLASSLGFQRHLLPDEGVVEVRLPLREAR